MSPQSKRWYHLYHSNPISLQYIYKLFMSLQFQDIPATPVSYKANPLKVYRRNNLNFSRSWLFAWYTRFLLPFLFFLDFNSSILQKIEVLY
jgi:hypothetical protein